MLYLLIICIVLSGVVFWEKLEDLDLLCFVTNEKQKKELLKEKRQFILVGILLIFFTVSTIAGTIVTSCSDFLSMTTEKSSNTYQVTDFSAKKEAYNLIGDYETKYSITIDDNLLIEISSQDFGTEIICNNYNPTTVILEERHYFKWWFLSPYTTYTYTLS